MIVLAKLPFFLTENDFLKEFVQNNLCPYLRKNSRNTARIILLGFGKARKKILKMRRQT